MKLGFAKNDITPRVGVELCGFGPFISRHSIGIRDRLWARAMVVETDGKRLLLISCDLIGIAPEISARVRALINAACGVPAEAIMIACSHTHSGPCTGTYIGWGEADPPYIETLPQRIAKAGIAAVASLQEATLSHAEVPCEGIGMNREYDGDALPLAQVLRDDWRPPRPELTDTTCHVLKATAADGRLIGFVSYFGCHPVVCCQLTRYIHGDYAGVATNNLEREAPGSVGLFLQGANGDVNSCCVHKPEPDSLLALDIIAARYANAVRNGLQAARPLADTRLGWVQNQVVFSRKPWGLDKLRELLAEKEAFVQAMDATDDAVVDKRGVRMETVYLLALRRMIALAEAGKPLSPAIEIHGLRIGPVGLFGSPFETFQAIKNEVTAGAKAPVPLVISVANDSIGYAPDRQAAARGGYAADMVPLICGSLPFASAHDELVRALLTVDAELAG